MKKALEISSTRNSYFSFISNFGQVLSIHFIGYLRWFLETPHSAKCTQNNTDFFRTSLLGTWPSGKLPFDCQKIDKNLTFFSKKLLKIAIFSTKLPLAILLKKMTSFCQFLTVKWQFSGGSGLYQSCDHIDMMENWSCVCAGYLPGIIQILPKWRLHQTENYSLKVQRSYTTASI